MDMCVAGFFRQTLKKQLLSRLFVNKYLRVDLFVLKGVSLLILLKCFFSHDVNT